MDQKLTCWDKIFTSSQNLFWIVWLLRANLSRDFHLNMFTNIPEDILRPKTQELSEFWVISSHTFLTLQVHSNSPLHDQFSSTLDSIHFPYKYRPSLTHLHKLWEPKNLCQDPIRTLELEFHFPFSTLQTLKNSTQWASPSSNEAHHIIC